jgi:NAD(P)H dehydrogenase (quinone)
VHDAPLALLPVSSPGGSVLGLAHAAADGLKWAGVTAEVIDCSRGAMDDHLCLVVRCRAVVFCCPTYLGAPDAAMLAWMQACDAVRSTGALANKWAAGITCGFAAEGGKTSTLTTLLTYALQHAMIWVGQDVVGSHVDEEGRRIEVNIDGHRLGVAARAIRVGQATDEGLAAAHLIGRRIGGFVGR